MDWELQFEAKIKQRDLGGDPAHDLAHFKRVVATAKALCQKENACSEVVVAAAWLHDFVYVSKNDPRRAQASRLAAAAAIEYLKSISYPHEFLDEIYHAIEAHSFSAGIEPRTLEARIVQDADRLDALGAIGIARVFSVCGVLKTKIYHAQTPFGEGRELNDQEFAVDHFYVKLFKIAETLKTEAGRNEGMRRVQYMRGYLDELAREIKIADQ